VLKRIRHSDAKIMNLDAFFTSSSSKLYLRSIFKITKLLEDNIEHTHVGDTHTGFGDNLL
jgi:hypothetical protein